MEVNTDHSSPVVRGLTDNRSATLADLAALAGDANRNLRHVLPTGEDRRVAVAAFGSSI